MCNLNVLIRNKRHRMTEKRVADTLAFMQSVTAHSYVSNKDADGVFFSCGVTARQTEKLNFGHYWSELQRSPVIMSHQRLSTSGPKEDIHPFTFGELTMAHNGVMSAYANDEHSDSYNFFETINKHFEENLTVEGVTREDAMVKAIKTELDKVAAGSYSIVIYDSVENATYYFKNSGRNIFFYQSDSYMFFTTNMSNGMFLDFFDQEFTELDADEYMIYKISEEDKGLNMEIVGAIEKYVWTAPSITKSQQHKLPGSVNHGYAKASKEEEEDEEDWGEHYTGKGRYKDDSDLTEQEYTGFRLVKKQKHCSECHCLTHYREVLSGAPVCEYCIGWELADEEE